MIEVGFWAQMPMVVVFAAGQHGVNMEGFGAKCRLPDAEDLVADFWRTSWRGKQKIVAKDCDSACFAEID